MKKKVFLALNIILLCALAVCIYIYDNINGRLVMKGTTASCFAVLGLVNLVYAVCSKPRKLAFPVCLSVGLILAMMGDILLWLRFIV